MSTSGSTPFTPPPPGPDDPTTSHLLSLPPLSSPISPSLAALHMARVRLLFDIPTSSSVGGMAEWWCHACGGLREGLGGASGPKKRGGKSRVKASPGQKIKMARKPAMCSNCGAKFVKARPIKGTLITYPSARIAARRKAEQEATEDVFTAPSEEASTSISSSVPVLPGGTAKSTINTTIGQSTAAPVNPIKRSPPSFSRVLNTEPNLPTYPPPAPSASPEKGKKRKKKSGLAKLLAENKERAAAQNLGGSWGLG